MRFFETLLAGAALVAAAFAVEINDFPSSIEPGKTYTITYTPADNTPTTFILRQGDNANLDTLQTLTTSATGGKFEWTVPKDLPNASDYALEIKQGNGPSNYIGPISLSGSTASSSASASSASSTASASSSASASASLTTSASASISSSASSNSTISSATLSRTGTSTRPTGSATSTESSGAPENTGAASTLGSSPMALIFGAVAAMAYLN